MSEIDVALICKALSDANRLKIVQMLTNGEECAGKLLEAFQITQPTLAHHMKVLSECNLIKTRRVGKWAYYSLNCSTLTSFREFIAQLNCDKNNGGCSCK